MPDQITPSYTHLDPAQQAKYVEVADYVAKLTASDPLGLEYLLNAAQATGPEDVADRVKAWGDIVADIYPERDRPAACQGWSDRAERLIHVPEMTEIYTLPDLPDA